MGILIFQGTGISIYWSKADLQVYFVYDSTWFFNPRFAGKDTDLKDKYSSFLDTTYNISNKIKYKSIPASIKVY